MLTWVRGNPRLVTALTLVALTTLVLAWLAMGRSGGGPGSRSAGRLTPPATGGTEPAPAATAPAPDLTPPAGPPAIPPAPAVVPTIVSTGARTAATVTAVVPGSGTRSTAPVSGSTSSGVLGATSGPAGSELYGSGNPGEPGTFPPLTSRVNDETGNLTLAASDIGIPGRGRALGFTRAYNALDAATAAAPGPLGWGWSGAYLMSLAVDPVSGVVTVHQENGSTTAFTPSGGGFSASPWVLATLAHNADGTYTYSLPNQWADAFSAGGQLTSLTDRNGYHTNLAYTAGHLSGITDPAGRTLTVALGGNGLIASVTDPSGRAVQYQYDAASDLTAVVDVGGATTAYAYDGSHRVTGVTDPRTNTTVYTYDASGRVVTVADPMSRGTSFQYGAVGTTITDPDNVVTSQQYANGVLASVTRAVGTPLAATWSYAYDGSYNLATTTDPDNHAWRATWDAHGNQLTATDPLNRVTTWTYDALNDRTSVVDPLGLTTHYTYDARGNPTGTSRTLDTTGQTVVTTVAYDPAHPGDAITTTDADTRAWTYTYDASGNLVQVADSLGETTTYGYDAAGRRVTAVAPRGNVAGGTPAAFTTTTTVNAYGAPTQVRDAGGGVTVDTYDANQNLVSVRDPEGNLTRTTYDADNEPAVVTRADASTNRATYDADGNVTARTDGLGHSTTYTFDALGRLATTTDPLARRTSYQYDGAGNLTRVTNPAGMLETRSYDAANQLTQIAYSDGATATATFAYDADGQRRTMTDASGASTLRYDSLHRIISSSDGLGHGMAYTYDLAGHVSGLTYDPGTVQSSVFGSQVGTGTVSRSYDLAGRMSTVTDWLGHVTHFAYDADGNLVTQAYPNNTTASFTYDNADRLTGIADVLNAAAGNAAVPFLTFPVGRGGDGEVASANPVSGPAPTTQTYTHDPLGRLSGAAVPAGTQSVPQYTYGYDSADNLTQSAIGPVGRRYTYDLADELTAVSDATTGVVLSASTYDLMGNRVRTVDSLGNIIAMTYDQANRMVTYTGPPVTSVNNVVGTNVQPLTYVYDATGLRHWKTLTATGQMVAGYVYDLAEGMPLITSADQVSYVTGPGGLPLEQVNDAGVVVYYHQDAIGSTRALTGQSGQVLTTYAYDPYGRATPSNTVAVAHFQWAGQYVDLDTGLQWMRARYYDPTTSQFTARDPLPAGVLQPYVYGRDDPVTLVDPTGLAATARGVPVGI